MRRFGHGHGRLIPVVEREQHGLGSRDRAEQGQDQIRQTIPVAIERGDDKRRVGGTGEQAGVGRVD